MKTMYPAQVNSPGTELAAAINATQDTIQVADGSVLPDAPNLLTIGTDEAAETILYTEKTGDELSGVTRGFQGTAQSWAMGTKVARYFTAYDHDATIGNINELLTGLTALGDETKDRLDTVQRQDVVLNAGVQILNAQRNAAFSLSGIKGRTLVNLAGRIGRADNPSALTLYQVTAVADSGASKITLQVGTGAIAVRPMYYKAEKKYILLGEVKNGNLSKEMVVQTAGAGSNMTALITSRESAKYVTLATKFAPLTDLNGSLEVVAEGDVGQYAWVKNLRAYEISAAEYAALDSMTPEQIAAKYPYVDSVQPVRNPYAIRYGENLAPQLSEWSLVDTVLQSANKAIMTPTAINRVTFIELPVVPGRDYTFSAQHTGNIALSYFDTADVPLSSSGYTSATSVTLTAPPSAGKARLSFSNLAVVTGSFEIADPVLSLGSEAKPFKPREDAMLALQTDLYANPVTGANADEVFEKDGQYFKIAKWKKVVLDGGQNWVYGPSAPGFKILSMRYLPPSTNWSSFLLTKFNGVILSAKESLTEGDKAHFNTSSGFTDFYISVPNTDSGWGDNYTPTADEIKAYFMGYKMYPAGGSGSAIYTGSGTKAWVYRTPSGLDGWQDVGTTLPTSPAPINAYWQPYQLVYQLATPTVESIVSEGMLTFNEGDNQIEVGTGMVVRESVKPFQSPVNGNTVINSTYPGEEMSKAKYPVERFLAIYKSGLPDTTWTHTVDIAGYTYGKDRLFKLGGINYDPSATYSVTYLMLDKSPIVPFTGSYAANEKAMFQELTDAVRQNANAVSALMQRKVEKDTPAVLITPTLLNGWKQYPLYQTVGYRKDSAGIVFLTGLVQGGPIVSTIFRLVDGFRPKHPLIFPVCTSAGANRVDVLADGYIYFNWAGAWDSDAWISLDGISFVPEQ